MPNLIYTFIDDAYVVQAKKINPEYKLNVQSFTLNISP